MRIFGRAGDCGEAHPKRPQSRQKRLHEANARRIRAARGTVRLGRVATGNA